MNKKIAIDTNVLVYLLELKEIPKRIISEKIICEDTCISAQTISEFFNVALRLLKVSKLDVIKRCNLIIDECEIIHVNKLTLQKAVNLIDKYDFQLFDAIIVASALLSGCQILYSEDRQHNLTVEKSLKIINPFL